MPPGNSMVQKSDAFVSASGVGDGVWARTSAELARTSAVAVASKQCRRVSIPQSPSFFPLAQIRICR